MIRDAFGELFGGTIQRLQIKTPAPAKAPAGITHLFRREAVPLRCEHAVRRRSADDLANARDHARASGVEVLVPV
jgi:hypothetical protein